MGKERKFDAAEYYEKIFLLTLEFHPDLTVAQARRLTKARVACNLNPQCKWSSAQVEAIFELFMGATQPFSPA